MRPKPAKLSNVKLSSLILLQISPEPSLSSQALDKPLLLACFNFMRQEVLRFKGGWISCEFNMFFLDLCIVFEWSATEHVRTLNIRSHTILVPDHTRPIQTYSGFQEVPQQLFNIVQHVKSSDSESQERAKRPARRALEQVKQRLVRKYGSVLRVKLRWWEYLSTVDFHCYFDSLAFSNAQVPEVPGRQSREMLLKTLARCIAVSDIFRPHFTTTLTHNDPTLLLGSQTPALLTEDVMGGFASLNMCKPWSISRDFALFALQILGLAMSCLSYLQTIKWCSDALKKWKG